MQRLDIPDPVLKRLYALSRNVCAYPGCKAQITLGMERGEPPSNLGEIAHIVAASRQGPRGDLEGVARNAIENLLLLCRVHHKLIDDHPRVYTVAVLQQYKRDHEGPGAAPTGPHEEMAEEEVDVTILPVRALPLTVYSAIPTKRTTVEIAELLPRPRRDLLPFALRNDRLFAFHDLSSRTSPFHACVERETVQRQARWQMMASTEGRSLYVWLLNSLMTRFLLRHGVALDKIHHRYYFLPDHQTVTRTIESRTKTGRRIRRKVVRQEGVRTHPRDIWWHMAVRLQFEEFADSSWGLTLRPEFHLTTDGRQPLPAHRIGRRVTRRKSRMYNDAYFEAVHFWRSFLTSGHRELHLRAGQQSLTIADSFPAAPARWPQIGGKTFEPRQVADAEEVDVLDLVVSQLSIDYDQEDWGAEFEEEDR